MIRYPSCEVGDVVEVFSVFGGYPLPAGLPEGAQVRIVRFQQAYRIVERDGQEWRVYLANVRARSQAKSTRDGVQPWR
jgi:hypothetical protein